ncbi:MAG: antitoxin [Firmicutes bacterium HGW-Firmicutes-13]|nr:MAG: antitoxin [Firmicutes bacterium HGW-Firmicutes-13]
MKYYDEEERKLIESIENEEWITVKDSEDNLNRLQGYAREELRKKKRINIRLSERDLEIIKRKAVEEGIPYQTLITSIIHKYITGKLVDKDIFHNIIRRK